MRKTAMAASAATFSAASLTAAGEESAGNVFHVFAFQWKPDASDAQKERAAKDIAAFQGKIPGLLETHVGPNISPRGKGYTFGGVMRFKDKDALDAYVVNPMHQTLLAWLVPLIDAIELDLNA
jgi:antibiotic biosynthesis monooxygenase (ABM) superfamily enzyme